MLFRSPRGVAPLVETFELGGNLVENAILAAAPFFSSHNLNLCSSYTLEAS